MWWRSTQPPLAGPSTPAPAGSSCTALLRTPIREDQVVASTDSLAGQVAAVVYSGLACILPRHLVSILARPGERWLIEAPELAEPFTVSLAWHPARDRDAGIAWLRTTIVVAATQEVEGSPAHRRELSPGT